MMTDEVKQLIDVMAMLDKCSETPCFKCDQLEFNGEIACNNEASVYQHAAKLLQDFSSELEQVKAERDGLSIMLTAAESAAETYKRERDTLLKELRGDCGICAHWEECRDSGYTLDRNYDSCWQWRGVKE